METLNEESGECAEQAVDSARTLGKRRVRENERERERTGREDQKERRKKMEKEVRQVLYPGLT